MSVQVELDFAGDSDAKAEIGAAVKYLLRGATGGARRRLVEEIVDLVRDVADGILQPTHPLTADAAKQPPMSGIAYKAFVIDAFQRDTNRWRATIRRSNGKKIRVAFPPSVLDEATTSADALTAEHAVELAKEAIDRGGLS